MAMTIMMPGAKRPGLGAASSAPAAPSGRAALALTLAAAGAASGWAAPAPAAPRLAAGKAAFAACASCHQVGPSARAGFGPQLNGIVGRPAGATPDYAYSAAMKNARIVWSAPTLAAFIRDPSATVPGTKMRFSSWGWSDQRVADLVAYLGTLPAMPAR